MATGKTGKFRCYFCTFISDDTISILLHTIQTVSSNFSLRKLVFDDKIGCDCFRSLYFPLTISDLIKYHLEGHTFNINLKTLKISIKRKHENNEPENIEPEIGSQQDKSTQTENSDAFRSFSKSLDALYDMNRYDDFLSLLQCIHEGIMSENIAFQLLMDVGNFYSKDVIQNTRYNETTLGFWVTVKKLFKGKGINFFRGFKGQGKGNDLCHITPKDCQINFVVPSNPILARESSKFNTDAENPGILTIPLNAFALSNFDKDVKLSFDGKKIAIGLGEDVGDENLSGFEAPPTLQERKSRLKNEIDNIKTTISNTDNKKMNGLKSVDELEVADSKLIKDALLLAVTDLSLRIKDLREFQVKRKRHVENLMKSVEGDWKDSKLAYSISYWQTKLIHARNIIMELLECVDILGYIVACINGTHFNYIRGTKLTIKLDKQENYVCLKEMDETEPSSELTPSPNMTKQRTDKWYQIRKESRVTGSTLFRALGLGYLKDQQKHFDRVYRGIETPISDDLQTMFDYGAAQETNAMGTLLCKILPVYYPDLIFKEDGCSTMPLGESKVTISGDGTGVDVNEQNRVAFEFKCPIAGKQHTTDVHYKLPTYYTTQVLSQMAVKECPEFGYICYTPDSSTYISGEMSEDVWKQTWNLTTQLYGKNDSSRLTRKNPDSNALLERLESFASNCKFIAEFPSVQTVPCGCEKANGLSDIYGHHKNDNDFQSSVVSLTEIEMALESSHTAITKAYELLRRPAKEVLVTVISDLNRQSQLETGESVPHAVPIHYALGGYSLLMTSVRKMLQETYKHVQQRRMNVRVVAFDRQFLELAVEDDDKRPLTVCRLMKNFWDQVKKTDRQVKLKSLISLNSLPNIKDIDDVSTYFEIKRSLTGVHLHFKLEKKEVGSPENIAKALKSKPSKTVKATVNDDEDVETGSGSDLLQYIPNKILTNLDEESMEILCKVSTCNNDDSLSRPKPVEDVNPIMDDSCTEDEHCQYEELLVSLIASRDENDEKWTSYTMDDFKDMLNCPVKINKTCNVSDLKFILEFSQKAPKGYKAFNKAELINAVSTIFGKGLQLLKRPKTPDSLKTLSVKHIRSWSIDRLNVAYAQLHFPSAFAEWESGNIFQGYWAIHTDTGRSYEMNQWYAQPKNVEGNYIQYIIDPHHIFVNNRSRCCSKGMLRMGIAPEAWWKVAESSKKNKTGLSWEIAKELKDRQSNALAHTTFSPKVEKVMRDYGDIEEANWCKLIRSWYKAIDDPGMAVHERLDIMFEMREFLLQLLKPGHFPPPGSFVADMPIAQFEGILTNIDRRLQLYYVVENGKYNQRSVSSLDSETFFSGFQDFDPKGSGVLRASDIPVALGTAVFLYQQRLNNKRGFYMKTAQKVRVYPEHVIESLVEPMEDISTGETKQNQRCIIARTHGFDSEDRKNLKPKRKSGTISDFGSESKGAEGARSYHKYNEEKILSHRRSGIMDHELFT